MLRGIHVPLITPFTETGEVAFDAVEKLARHVLDQGAAGLVALGTTGEVAALDEEERAGVIAACLATGAPVIVGVSGNDTRSTARALRELPAGVAAALVPVP
ncbi:MAG: 4-hydroxy-tetrahydrodipicolinate synthase, partial [Nonomuraea sp.]|nr:4-hydroxy-tetrahydrodipicolinate synthase [Nonomuraea sp.]